MRFIIGVLLGYYMRGKKRLLIITLTVYIGLIIICSVVLPAIALSMLGLSVMRERASRPPQTSVPVVVGVDYETAQIKLRGANLKIRVLAKRHDPLFEPTYLMSSALVIILPTRLRPAFSASNWRSRLEQIGMFSLDHVGQTLIS